MPRRLVLALTLVLAPAVARAEPSGPPSCMTAYEQAQRLRRQGTLLESRAQLYVCARDPCPASLQPDCLRWLGEVDHLVPSIVVTVRRDDGTDANDARVFIDGLLKVERLDGSAIEVNPGEHVVRIEMGEVVLEQSVLSHVAEKGRQVSFRVHDAPAPPAPAPPPPPPQAHRPVGWPTFVLGGLGLVGLGVFTGFAVQGESRYGDLGDCRPGCDPRDVDAVRTSYRVADIALAVSFVAASAALVTFLVRPTVYTSTASR